MNEVGDIQHLEPKIIEKRIWNHNHLFAGFFIAIVFIGIALFLIMYYNLDLTNSLIVILSVVLIYSGILFFLIEPKVLRQVENTVVHKIEKPVIKEIPVEKKIFVDRPIEVIKEVQVPVEKTIFIDRPVEKIVEVPSEPSIITYPEPQKSKLNIPKYDFIASEETRTYHTRNCRFSKLIKRKYKLVSNDEKDFIKEKFKPCKVCIKTKKKKK